MAAAVPAIVDAFYPEYGYVILVSVAFFLLVFAQTVRVSRLRVRHSIDYPAMTSDEHPDFNCAQRVHHNTLEQLPFVLANMAFGGLCHPALASAFGSCYFLGRILYSVGYWTGKPHYRLPGSTFGFVCGLLPLVGVSVATAGKMIGWW